jgi:hypothetical protein
MDAGEVLAAVRSGSTPGSWTVWPLQPDRVRRSVRSWAIAAIFGFALFIPFVIMVLQPNFFSGWFSIVVSGLLLLLLGAVAFGSLAIMLFDVWRLRHADEFLVVVTPQDYIKAEPGKITHVPTSEILYVTLRGVKVPERAPARAEREQAPTRGVMGQMMNPGILRREPARAPSLSFLDLRTDTEVTVTTDDSFGDLLALAETLRTFAHGDERRQAG